MTEVTEFDFRQAFIDQIEKTQRVWSHDRSLTLGASEVFGCLRRSWYLKHAPELADPSLMSLGAATRGNVIENAFVVPMLKGIFGEERIKFASEDQESFVSGLNSATPDALIFPRSRAILKKYGVDDIGSDSFATEIKSFDPRMTIDEEKVIHRGQGIVQLGLINELTEYDPKYVVILYVNAANFYDIRPFVVAYDEQIFQAARFRAKTVFEAKSAYDVKAEGKVNDQCRYCPFIFSCRTIEADQHPGKGTKAQLTEGEIKRLNIMASTYRAALEEEKAAVEKKKEMAEDIKRFLNAVGTSKVVTDDYKVSHSKMDGKETLDKAAMEADGINLEEYKKIGAPFTRLQILDA